MGACGWLLCVLFVEISVNTENLKLHENRHYSNKVFLTSLK